MLFRGKQKHSKYSIVCLTTDKSQTFLITPPFWESNNADKMWHWTIVSYSLFMAPRKNKLLHAFNIFWVSAKVSSSSNALSF